MKNLPDTLGSAVPVARRPAPPPPRPPAPLLSRFHTARRIAGKLSRQLGKLAGRPDNAPWVLRPSRRSVQNTFVDFVVGLDYLSPRSRLVELFHEAMSPFGLSVLLVNERNVARATADMNRGWL